MKQKNQIRAKRTPREMHKVAGQRAVIPSEAKKQPNIKQAKARNCWSRQKLLNNNTLFWNTRHVLDGMGQCCQLVTRLHHFQCFDSNQVNDTCRLHSNQKMRYLTHSTFLVPARGGYKRDRSLLCFSLCIIKASSAVHHSNCLFPLSF